MNSVMFFSLKNFLSYFYKNFQFLLIINQLETFQIKNLILYFFYSNLVITIKSKNLFSFLAIISSTFFATDFIIISKCGELIEFL